MTEYRDPKIRIDRVYTRGGDKGTTSLVGGQRVAKSSTRIEAYGEVDELNACVGLLRNHAPAEARPLMRIQNQLFNLGSILATLPEDVGANQPRVTTEDIAWLESMMDAWSTDLPALTNFVLPGGSVADAYAHLARTVCRRVERKLCALHEEGGGYLVEVAYVNRLSDFFFVLGRHLLRLEGKQEFTWQPNA